MNLALARSIADLSSRWRNRFSRWRRSPKSGHLGRGAGGERLACRYLKHNGYKVLVRNFRGRSGGEIDVVCRNNDTLVFVEVKTRSSFNQPSALDAVTPRKRQRLARAAMSYMKWKKLGGSSMRFDLVLIEAGQIQWIPDAIEQPSHYTY